MGCLNLLLLLLLLLLRGRRLLLLLREVWWRPKAMAAKVVQLVTQVPATGGHST
jgi:hypothetical protein